MSGRVRSGLVGSGLVRVRVVEFGLKTCVAMKFVDDDDDDDLI